MDITPQVINEVEFHQRMRGYDPDVHLGGVAYLFLRGMTGPDVPTFDGSTCGVFIWRPAPAFVLDLSDLFDRGDP